MPTAELQQSTLSTLQENLESVSLEDYQVEPKPLRIVKRSTSQTFASSTRGLGIGAAPRRPSDNTLLKTIQSKNNSKVSILERPVSNDSITSSTVSDFSEEVNSRNSSITSGSIGNSPTMLMSASTPSLCDSKLNTVQQMAFKKSASQLSIHRLRESASTPKLTPKYSSHSQISLAAQVSTPMTQPNLSTSTVNTLTPSQRYRLRRQNSKSSSKATIREREKYFDDVNSDDETFADGLIWNVPYTKGPATLFSPSSGKSPAMIKSIMDDSPAMLPMSPLPGSAPASPMVNQNGGFYQNDDAAHSIAKFYEETSENFAKTELKNRELSSSNLPSIVKQASSLGLDDMKLISKEKAGSLSTTRPIWLPPKPFQESKKHDRDISKMLEKVAKMDKKKQEEQEILRSSMEKNRQRWSELEERGITRSSSQHEIKKLCFKTAVPDHLKYRVWSQTMNMRLDKSPYEKYDDLKLKLSQIPELPSSKMVEIEKLIEGVFIEMKLFQAGQELNEKLTHLIKMKMISGNGLEVGDEIVMAVLLVKFNEVDTYNLTNWMRCTVFDEVSMSKFNNNLTKNHVMKKYLHDNEFKADISQLNSNMLYSLFLHVQDLTTIYQILDCVILNGGYKVWYSLFLTLLREFHFGFNDLDSLMESDVFIYINDTHKFFERAYYHFKKF